MKSFISCALYGLILAGIKTHACVRTTAIDAYQRDWPLILASECVDSYEREHHHVTLEYMKDKVVTLMANRDIAAMLKQIKIQLCRVGRGSVRARHIACGWRMSPKWDHLQHRLVHHL